MNQVCTFGRHETVLFDEESLANVSPKLFFPKGVGATANQRGRGSVYFFEEQGLQLVLRHYRRGGLVRHLVKDNYFFRGLDATRMWREFHLLQALRALDLPVPKALAVRCVKTSVISYRGDLISECIAQSKTLAEALEQQSISDEQWQALGQVLARFHSLGVYHADLNANNIMMNAEGKFYLIDFDRGELRAKSNSAPWKEQNLQRLQRSFLKLDRLNHSFHFGPKQWQLLLAAYSDCSYSAR